MKITINNQEIEVTGQDTLLVELQRLGIHIPTLCYSKQQKHVASCMVCMVKNVATGQMIPSCSVRPTEGMCIDTDSAEVREMRKTALELLLSDHRADCEAPCTQVCSRGLDVAQLLLFYDRGQFAQAKALLNANSNVNVNANANPDSLTRRLVDSTPVSFCHECKAPCEKACRRRTIDSAVSIRQIIAQVESMDVLPIKVDGVTADKQAFCSRLGRYNEAERQRMKEIYDTPTRCLHCACEGRSKCKLRPLATEAGIKTIPFGVSSAAPVKEQIRVGQRLVFEPAKCIHCGLCVYNTEDGFTFQHRGFNMQVVIPETSKANVPDEIAEICPTGALYVES